jgi:hypothetical protein
MEDKRSLYVFLSVAACLAVIAYAGMHSYGKPSPQQVALGPAMQASIRASATSISPGQIITLNTTVNGGTEPYTFKWYSGTNQQCQYDTDLLQTDSQVYRLSDLFSTFPPNGGSYYCAAVTDSSNPPLNATSPVIGIIVGAATSTTTIPANAVAAPNGTLVSAPNQSASRQTAAVISQLCVIVNSVRSIIGIIALVLFMLGGILYAISHFLPNSLEFKKSMTGWSTAMIVGGIIGLVVVLIAQPLILMIIGLGQSAGGAALPLASC